MSRYSYEALFPDGTLASGIVDAPTAADAARRLDDTGLLPVRLKRAPDRRPMRRADLAAGLENLASLVEGGISLGRALPVLPLVAPRAWRDVAPRLAREIEDGRSLGRALGMILPELPAATIAVVLAGERGSHLSAALRRAADALAQAAETEREIRSALTYPLFLVTSAALSVALIGGWVVPRFARVLEGLGEDLPWTTELLLAATALGERALLPALGLAVMAVVFGTAWARSDAGRERLHEALFTAPVIGPLRRRLGTARACLTASGLVESGVSVPEALALAADATGDRAQRGRLLATGQRVLRGETVAHALSEEDAVTGSAVELVAVGEQSGALGAMLSRAGSIEGQAVRAQVRTLTRLAEPALVLLVGAAVAFVAVALLQAVYSVRPLP